MLVQGIKAKIAYLNLVSRVRSPKPHVSGYVSGTSPDTDMLAEVDKSGNVIGSVRRRHAHDYGVLHATVHLLLFNSRDELLVQMRSPFKDSSPRKLSQSVGGHVSYGLSPTEVLAKETYEELGIMIERPKLISAYLYDSNQGKNRELVCLFKGSHNGPVYPNYSEVSWAAFFGVDGIKALAQKDPKRFAPSFIADLRYYIS